LKTQKKSSGRDGAASTLINLESWWRTVLDSLYSDWVRWLPRKVYGEHGRIVIFSALTEYVGE